MPAVSVLTIENEAVVRGQLRTLLSNDSECELIGEFTNGAEAVRALAGAQPDIVFVEAGLPGMDGFEVARAVAGRQSLVIFTSDSGDHAVRAFAARAFDYLLKPLEEARFQVALGRAKTEVSRIRTQAIAGEGDRRPANPAEFSKTAQSPRPAPGRIAVRENNRVIFLTLDQIDWIEAADNYVCLHTAGATHVLRETMKQMEDCLDPARFARIHRSAIVNLDRIQEMQPWFRGEYRVILRDGTTLTMTKKHREKLDTRLLLGRIA